MLSRGIKISKFAKIQLILEAKIGNNPLTK